MRIFCFGDSNTYGYDARSYLGERLPAGERWPEILGEQYGWEIQNEGMNGRKIPGEAWSLAGFDRALLNWGETDLLLIMLGTNDFKQRFHVTASDIALSLDRLVRTAQSMTNGVAPKPFQILLACPAPLRPQTCLGEMIGDRSAESASLPPLVQDVANRCGVHFINVGAFAEASPLDGLHYDRENHMRIAAAMENKIREILG